MLYNDCDIKCYNYAAYDSSTNYVVILKWSIMQEHDIKLTSQHLHCDRWQAISAGVRVDYALP